jgi:N,N'-diacetyllegionaminate synthase
MRIGPIELGVRVAVVAEIGNNHEGDPDVARELVRQAAAAGCDAVKLQTFHADTFVRRSDTSRLERMRGFELSHEVVAELGEFARSLGLAFLSTPLDMESVGFLAPLVDGLKVASGDNDVPALIAACAGTDKPVVISAGMTDLGAIAGAVDTVRRRRRDTGREDDVAVLHCVTSYPAPANEVNLAAIGLLAEELACPVGYSDHDLGIEVAVLAVAAGACLIEKHFTLAKDFSDFRDHALSADPEEMRSLVDRARFAWQVRGRPAKEPQPCEADFQVVARRSIVAARELAQGHVLADADLTWMRPRDGLLPGEEHLLVGRTLKRDIAFTESIRPDDLV